ncbi:MAG: hypothetical protein MZV70_11000 [Desulfobacterales bacterium]|nr:hypothetical protein [Desulfobacterales bacterium]
MIAAPRTPRPSSCRTARSSAKGMVPTGFDQGKAVEDSLAMAVQQAGIARTDVQRICGTGSGRNAVQIAD